MTTPFLSWTRATLPPGALALALACGGGSGGGTTPSADPNAVVASSAAMTAEEAGALTACVLGGFQLKSSSADLGAVASAGEPGVLAVDPALPACVSVLPSQSGGVVTTTYTFSNCTSSAGGGTVSGVIVTTRPLGGSSYTIAYTNLQVVRGGESLVLNGTQTASLNPVTRTSTVAIPSPGMTIAYSKAGSTLSGTYTLVGSWTGDYATAQTFKLSGSSTLTRPGGATTTVAVEASDPLTWRESPACCYPTAGTLKLSETVALSGGGQASTASRLVAAYGFTSVCGTVAYTTYTYQLTRSGGVTQVPAGPTSVVLPACP